MSNPFDNPFDVAPAPSAPAQDFGLLTNPHPAPVNFAPVETAVSQKGSVLQAIPFTDSAKNLINTFDTVKFSDTLPRGVGGQTNVPQLNTGNVSKNTPIEVAFQQPHTVMAHELFNSIFSRSNIKPDAFNAAWDTATKNDPELATLDTRLNDPKNNAAFRGNGENIDTDPYSKASERFALLGSLWGNDGLSSLPKDLQPFYKSYLLDTKQKPVEAVTPFDATPSGIIYNTILGLQDPNVTVPVLADVFHGVTDFFGSMGVSVNDIFHGGTPSGGVDFGKVGDRVSPIIGTVMRGLFGAAPVQDTATRLEDFFKNPITQQLASKMPNNPGVTDQQTNQKLNAVKLAMLGVVGGDALNFLGGGDGAIEKDILKSVSDDASATLLKKMGLSDELVTKFTPTVTSAKTPEESQAVLTAIKYAHGAQAVAESGPAVEVSKQIQEQFPEVPVSTADSIATKAVTETDKSPNAIEEFVQKEVDAIPKSDHAAVDTHLSAQDNRDNVITGTNQTARQWAAQELKRLDIAGTERAPGSVRPTEGGGVTPSKQDAGVTPDWKLNGFSTKKEYDTALRDIASYGESDKHQTIRNIIAGKIKFKPGSDASEWKAILGNRYYTVFQKDAASHVDALASELGYQDSEEFKNDVADEMYRRANANLNKGTTARKAKDTTRTLTESLTSPIQGEATAGVQPVSMPAVSIDESTPHTSEEAAGRYWDEVISKLKGTGKTIEVSGDAMKQFFHGDYHPEKSDMYAQASFDTMKRLSVDPEVKTMAWLGGGPGAGKTEFIGSIIKDSNLADVLYDTTLTNTKGARELLNLARENNKEVSVDAILANLQEARRNTLIREAKTGRPVTDEAFADRHAKFPETVRELLDDGSLKKEQLRLYDLRNVTNPEEAKQIIKLGLFQKDPLATLQKVRYNRDILVNQYARQNFKTENRRSNAVAGERGATGGLPSGNRPDQGSTGERVASEVAGGKARVGEGTPAVSVGEGTQATRAAQEEAAAAAGPQPIRDIIPIPSAGDITLENGRKVAIEQSPADTIQEITKGPEAGSWQALVRGYMSNYSPTKKAHVFDYLATPEFVLEKVGLGKGAEMLHDAQDTYRNTLKKEFSKIEEWQNRVKESLATKYRMTHDGVYVPDQTKGIIVSPGDATRSIFRYLDGREKDAYPEMNPTTLEVAREVRSYLKEWAVRLKLPEDNQISRYITHIFERDFNAGPEESFMDPELSAIMSENVAKSVYDPFLLKRTGKPGYIEDVWRALDAYVKRASRKEAMDPALEELSTMAKSLDDRTYNYVKQLSHRVNMRPTELEKSMDSFITQTPIGQYFTNRPTAFLTRRLRQVFYRGTLGLNFSAALRNLSQGANTYAKLGEKYTTIGYAKLFSRMASRNLTELFDQNILSDELVQDRTVGLIKKGMQTVDKGLFGMFDTVEKFNRGAAYFGAKSRGMNKGLSEEQAIKYAKRIVRETQFAFGAVDTPVFLNDDVVKTVTQLQSYNIKQAEFLGRMIKQKDFAGLIRYSAASLAFLYTIGRAFGMTASQIIPTIGIGGAPLTSTVTSIAGLFSSNPQTKAKAQSQLQRNFASLFPAGAQIRKTLQGAEDLMRGKDVTPAGKFRFRVDSSNAAQALLFGPSALPQAQQYYNSIGQKKTAVQGSNPFD